MLPCFTWNGEPVYRHMDLVRHWSGDRQTIAAAARRAGVKAIVLEGAAMRRFKRENEIMTRMGRSIKLYRGASSIEAIRDALEPLKAKRTPLPPTMVDFEGRQLRIRYDSSGGAFVVARELEEILGLRRGLLQEWAREFQGDFCGYLSRAQLLEERPQPSPLRTFSQRKLVLFDHGVYQVAGKCEERTRGWLLHSALPELSRTGYFGHLLLQPAGAPHRTTTPTETSGSALTPRSPQA